MDYSLESRRWAPLDVAGVVDLLSRAGTGWWLSGGLAIDQWLGSPSRKHNDIDVSVVRDEWRTLIDALPPHLEAAAAVDGRLLSLDEWTSDPRLHNLWVRDRSSGQWVLQVNIEEGDARAWRYRRDVRVERSWGLAVAEIEGVPTGTPATQLLWKSKRPAAKDNADLRRVLPLLEPDEVRWLRDAIDVAHPESPRASQLRR